MGFNTTVMIMNDDLQKIRDNPMSFVDSLVSTILSGGKGKIPGGEVVETHHADEYAIVAIGGNTAKVLGFTENADLTRIQANIRE